MEQNELDLIAKHADQDEELKQLWEKHLEYEQVLEKYENKPYLTPSDQVEVKQIKKKKLAGKTKLLGLLDKYKEMEA